MGNSHQLFQSLFNKDLLANDSKDFLKQLINKYPYFTAAHFFLLKQTAFDTADFEIQAATTSLLFNNPYWLNFQINHTFEEEIVNPQIFKNDVSKKEILNEITVEQPQEINLTEDPIKLVSNNSDNPFTATSATVEIAEEVLPIEKYKGTDTNLPKFIFNKDEDNGEDEYTDDDNEYVENKEIEPMNIKLNFTNINTTEDTITFEPLHVSDYFTSVGIKLTDEIKPGDKLGKQLKSFTEWLKIMKKVHVEQLQEEIADNNDLIIQQMAEKSNKEEETLTEAMADVLTQQGKTDKAIEIYQKLSLLNPVKSAYFAAKIGQIIG